MVQIGPLIRKLWSFKVANVTHHPLPPTPRKLSRKLRATEILVLYSTTKSIRFCLWHINSLFYCKFNVTIASYLSNYFFLNCDIYTISLLVTINDMKLILHQLYITSKHTWYCMGGYSVIGHLVKCTGPTYTTRFTTT